MGFQGTPGIPRGCHAGASSGAASGAPTATSRLERLERRPWAAPDASAAGAPTAKLILFGGFTGEGLSNDVWTVAPDAAARGEAGAFEQVPTRGAPATRFAHCVAAASDRLLVFGGSAPATECDDLFELRLPLA